MVDSFFVDPSKKKRRNRDNRNTSTIQQNNKRQKSSNNDKKKGKSSNLINPSEVSNHYETIHAQDSNNSEKDGEGSEISDIDEEANDSDIFADIGNQADEVDDINEDDDEEEEDIKNETEADKRRRLAKKYLEDLKASLGAGGSDDENGNYAFDAKDLDDEIISSRLKKDVAEQKGWVYKFYGDKLDEELLKRKITRVPNNCLTSICVNYPYIFTTSKDMEISKWDIRDSKKNPKLLKTVKGGDQYQELSKEHSENGHCDEIYTSVTSPDGKYLVTGGKDGRIIVWSINSLSCIRVLETKNKRGEVLSLTFRRNSDQLYAACADLKIRTYSINQLSQLETLYGHQDLVVDISALGLERCVTVGSRDRTAMLWKIAEESRLTFRGGDSHEKYSKDKDEQMFFEGSIDCVSMIDDSHFVTGSDNGNISLWSLNKKKPLFTNRLSHGIQPKMKAVDASSEKNEEIAELQISKPQPFWITTIYALPFSDIFISGSWDGNLNIWKLDENLRSFKLLKNIQVNGLINRISVFEDEENNELRIYAALSKEHKFNRGIKPLAGSRNALFTCILKLNK